MSDYKFWIFHGGSGCYFAARDVKDAWEVVQEMNNISIKYDLYPTSRVEVVDNNNPDDLALHAEELAMRNKEGDDFYFMP